jgi:hypothetical protein
MLAAATFAAALAWAPLPPATLERTEVLPRGSTARST